MLFGVTFKHEKIFQKVGFRCIFNFIKDAATIPTQKSAGTFHQMMICFRIKRGITMVIPLFS
jgi:hypothetical protein